MSKLSNKQVNEMLRAAFADAVPDRSQEILDGVKRHNTAPTVCVTQIDRRGTYRRTAALTAAAVLIVVGLIAVLTAVRSREVVATVQLESDAIVEVGLNRDCRPVALKGADSAGALLAKRIDRGESLESAIDHTLDTMRDRGSLSDAGNTVLITVDADEDAKELLKNALTAAKNSFEDEGFDGAILTAVASEDSGILRMARRWRISVGKAEMIADILKKDQSFSGELLARLSVNDLNLLSAYCHISYAHIQCYGESVGCISPEDAIAYAVRESGIADQNAEARLGVDTYGLIYSVTLHDTDRVYIFRLNASSGAIIAVSQGGDLETALMNDRNTPSPAPTETPSAVTSDATSAATASGVSPTADQQLTAASQPATERPAATQAAPTSPPVTNAPQPAPATARPTEAPKPVPATVRPTEAPKPTAPPVTSPPTEPPKREPAVFAANDFIRIASGNGSPSSGARQVALRRIINSYNTFYDDAHFPYSPAGQQGGITALVCNREQLYRLTGSADSRFDDSYFAEHVLYVYMNRDISYHWTKSVESAYMDGGVLYFKNSEPVGYYIPQGSENANRIYTVVYELDKSELSDFVSAVEYTG